MFKDIPEQYQMYFTALPFKDIVDREEKNYGNVYGYKGVCTAPDGKDYQGRIRIIISDVTNPKGEIQVDFKSDEMYEKFHLVEAGFFLFDSSIWKVDWWVMADDHVYRNTQDSWVLIG